RLVAVAGHRGQCSFRIRDRCVGSSAGPLHHLRRRVQAERTEREWIYDELERPSGTTPRDRYSALLRDRDLIRCEIVPPRLHENRARALESVEINARLIGRDLQRTSDGKAVQRGQAVREGRKGGGGRGHQANDDYGGTTLRG